MKMRKNSIKAIYIVSWILFVNGMVFNFKDLLSRSISKNNLGLLSFFAILIGFLCIKRIIKLTESFINPDLPTKKEVKIYFINKRPRWLRGLLTIIGVTIGINFLIFFYVSKVLGNHEITKIYEIIVMYGHLHFAFLFAVFTFHPDSNT